MAMQSHWTRLQELIGLLLSTGCLKKEFYNGIPNVTVWLMLRKRLQLKAYKLSIFQGVKCKRVGNTRHTVTFGIPF
jgi:hypothetical protein